MKIDWWTLALQTVNLIVLLWLLQRFLFKPVLAIIAQRQQAARQLSADAQAAKARADQERAALEADRATLTSGREQALAAARAEAQKAREELLAQAAQEVRQRQAVASAALERERAEAMAALRARATVLAGDLARRLLERLPGASWNRHFVDGACRELAALAPAESELLRRGDGDATVQALSADTLNSDDQDALRRALGTALGREAAVTFVVDASLIAGVELRSRHLLIRNHWAADLERLLELLPRDEHPAGTA